MSRLYVPALLLLPFCLASAAAAQNNIPTFSSMSAPLPPNAPSYRILKEQIEENLRTEVLDQWFPRAIASTNGGGFDENFSENWTNTSNGERSIVFQARLTWLASQAALRYPAEATRWKETASHGADFLRTQMWDSVKGGFFWKLNQGKPDRNGEKHAYGISFAIYALSAHYRATGDARSLDLAKRAFRWLDDRAHDEKSGGYFEAFTREGRPILSPSKESGNDFIGTRYGYKSMNTHIHLLEAFASLYEVWPDKKLKARLGEVFSLVRDTIVISPPGAMNLFFTPAWKPVPDHDSYGHDIETAYLLVEAAHVLGRSDDERTWAVSRSLVDHTLEFGRDETNGGFYDAGGTFGGVWKDDKVWWVQAEALNALLLMHQKYGAQTSRYWEAFQSQWSFIQNHQIDRTNGGWFNHVSKTGESFPDLPKSDGWTEGYHQGRALLNVSHVLNDMMK